MIIFQNHIYQSQNMDEKQTIIRADISTTKARKSNIQPKSSLEQPNNFFNLLPHFAQRFWWKFFVKFGQWYV